MKLSTLSSRFHSSVLACIVAAAVVAPGYSAIAQSSPVREVANVPFDFRSGSNLMPAGKYEITKLSDHILLLRGTDQARSQIIPAFDTISMKPQNHGKLVFHRYGNQYFLYQVWSEGHSDGFQLPKGHAEKEMLRAKAEPVHSTTELALNQEPR